jgi:hypothetical protein
MSMPIVIAKLTPSLRDELVKSGPEALRALFGDGGPDFDPDRDMFLGYDYRDVDFLVEDPDHPFATLLGTEAKYGVVFMDGLEFTNGPPSWFSPEETARLRAEIVEADDCPLLGLEDFLDEAIAERKGLLVGVD